jgi:hypothetical protein
LALARSWALQVVPENLANAQIFTGVGGARSNAAWSLPTTNPLAHRAPTCGGALLGYELFHYEPLR